MNAGSSGNVEMDAKCCASVLRLSMGEADGRGLVIMEGVDVEWKEWYGARLSISHDDPWILVGPTLPSTWSLLLSWHHEMHVVLVSCLVADVME